MKMKTRENKVTKMPPYLGAVASCLQSVQYSHLYIGIPKLPSFFKFYQLFSLLVYLENICTEKILRKQMAKMSTAEIKQRGSVSPSAKESCFKEGEIQKR